MPDNVYEFHYSGQDVASAQRTRFLGSLQFKVIVLLWLVTIVYLTLPIFLPGKIPGMAESSWALVLQICLAYVVTMAVLVFITPWLDYLFRRFWHVKLELRFNEKMMQVNVAGKPGGLKLDWTQLRRVQENRRVFIIEYDASSKYLILPKSTFSKPGSEKRFRDVLVRRSNPASTQIKDTLQSPTDAEKRTGDVKAKQNKQPTKR